MRITYELTGCLTKNKNLTGIVKKVSRNLIGTIEKPSYQTPAIEGDHKFITVDLVKMQAQQIAVDNVNAIVPFTATNTQTISRQININAVPAIIAVNQMTATVPFLSEITTVRQVTAIVNWEAYN